MGSDLFIRFLKRQYPHIFKNIKAEYSGVPGMHMPCFNIKGTDTVQLKVRGVESGTGINRAVF